MSNDNNNSGSEILSPPDVIQSEALVEEDRHFQLIVTQNFDDGFLKTQDYIDIVKCMDLLRQQRQQIIHQRDQILREREIALLDPATYMENLANQKSSPMSSVMPLFSSTEGNEQIPEVPNFNFQKYELLASKDGPRKRKRKSSMSRSKKTLQSHGILWTAEEQNKLETLLRKHPDEPVASHRWEKIARELGNRTPKQVASRVQKYFIKLAKAGLPVPGKLPNMEYYLQKDKKRARGSNTPKIDEDPKKITIHTCDIAYYAPPPVTMPKEEQQDIIGGRISSGSLHNNEKEKVVQITQEVIHEGYRCNSCGIEPILGPRWRCTVCPEYDKVDLCHQCRNIGWKNYCHKPNHTLEKIEAVEAPFYVDGDYVHSAKDGDINYLDPTFMPV